MSISCKRWGVMPDGSPVHLYTITNATGNSVSVSSFGGIITSIRMPDASGKLEDVVLGYDTLEEYIEDDAYFGAMIGRYANRIERGQFALNGQIFHLTKNQNGHTLHGGSGFNKKLWKAHTSSNILAISYHSPDGEDGFPGALDATVHFSLSDENRLTLDIVAIADRDTICCLTNHSYFNLAGQGDIFSHLFQIHSAAYTPFLPSFLPDGSIQTVDNSPFDFRTPQKMKDPLFNANYLLSDIAVPCVCVTDPHSGRQLTVSTTLPAVQVYVAGDIPARHGRGNRFYPPNSGFCLEPQYIPNSPNLPQFPSCVLKKGELYHHTIHYQFSTI